MGVFKVLAGVALGVGAVAAAPFTGGGSILGAATLAGSLAGTTAVAGAVAAGVAGGAAGAALSYSEKKDKEKELKQARVQGQIDTEEKLTEEIDSLKSDKSANESMQKAVIGLFAVGLAVANVDGNISEEEEDDINLFVGGLSQEYFTETMLETIAALRHNPPTFEQAIQKALFEYGCNSSAIDELIYKIAESDSTITVEEEELILSWEEYKKTL